MGGYVSSDIIKPFRLKNEDAKNNNNTNNDNNNNNNINKRIQPIKETIIDDMEENENESSIKDLTSIVGYKKYEGELIQLMQIAMKNNKYDKVDDYIRTEVVKYLYNDGRGKNVPVNELVIRRIKSKKGNEKIPKKVYDELAATTFSKDQLNQRNTRFCCFDINKRGKSGETLLDLCLLNPTSVSMKLAERILTIFPNTIKDFNVSDEYYGENLLHMAIVNEDPYFVKFLIKHGVDCNQRCTGRFFFPDDQKKRIQETLTTEYPITPVDTNYKGLSYYGEYPLSFAAVLNQEEIVRLLISKYADPNKQDSNGNTVLHILIINDNVEMFKLLVESGRCDLTLKNRQNLTPLTLAAKLARNEIFFFILETIRKIYWIYSDITCAAYPLTDADTIVDDGSYDMNSCLYLVLNTNTEEHLELLEGFLTDLLYKKWTTFVKIRFYVECLLYAFYYILIATTIFMKRTYYDYLIKNNHTMTVAPENSTTLLPEYQCAYKYPLDEPKDNYPRTIIEIIVLLYTILFILKTLNELYIQKWKLFFNSILANPTKIFFIFSLVLILLIFVFRLSCSTSAEDICVALLIIFLSVYGLYFGRGFQKICTFVYNVHMIVGNVMLKFGIIYSIFLLGFSQMFYLIAVEINPPGDDSSFKTNAFHSILFTFITTLAEVSLDMETFPTTVYVVLGEIFFTVFLILGNILLLNMLIAMMDNQQEITNDRPNEWIRQWGLQILAVEININPKERLKQKALYSNKLDNGQKALIVRWQQNAEEREALKHEIETFHRSIRKIPNHDTYK